MTDADPREAAREARIPNNLAAIDRLLRECADLSSRGREEFFGPDFVNRYAAYALLIQVGNAVKDLPDGFRAAHPDVGWRRFAGVRDKVGHIYGVDVDWKTIWAVISVNVPQELDALARIRESLD